MKNVSWDEYCAELCWCSSLEIAVDSAHLRVSAEQRTGLEARFQDAFAAMAALEDGAVANPDEGRQVGHYWLRAPQLAPDPAQGEAIRTAKAAIDAFCASVHAGRIQAPGGAPFSDFLLIGIGGSALGPQFIAEALAPPSAALGAHFIDNTDPDGIDRTLARLGERLARTLVLVTSKSGTTAETRNGQLEVAAAFDAAGLDFARQAVAVTGAGSALEQQAQQDGWLATFPMWDWVGGRTSVTSAVGLLPAALQGIDTAALLEGAARMDQYTRSTEVAANPAARLALAWYVAGNGQGARDMVVLPYKDSLLLFSRYLQQLIMESLGKGHDLDGNPVAQGIAVYGNKGSTDQHAYVQQLREGIDNFFVTFIEVLEDRAGASMEVAPGNTAGDYLSGFLHGTRTALRENGRHSLTVTLPRVDAATVGALIALYERAVGLYAFLVNINAYHQPGVEAGKKAATEQLALQARVLAILHNGGSHSIADLAAAAAAKGNEVAVYHLLRHLQANDRGVLLDGDPARPQFLQVRLR